MDRTKLRTYVFASWLAIVAGTGCGAEDVAQSSADAAADAGVDGIAKTECPRFATGATDHAFGDGQNAGQAAFPAPLLGPPKGFGCCKGSLDVVSLGNGGTVTLEFGDTLITDGPGPDFIVFENAFFIGGDETKPFAELATVEVSEDGQSWHAFECTASAPPYGSCAGWRPVFANAGENALDPLDPEVAGGDAFDLGAIGVGQARYVRITDRPDLTGTNGVFDLDAVGVVNALCP